MTQHSPDITIVFHEDEDGNVIDFLPLKSTPSEIVEMRMRQGKAPPELRIADEDSADEAADFAAAEARAIAAAESLIAEEEAEKAAQNAPRKKAKKKRSVQEAAPPTPLPASTTATSARRRRRKAAKAEQQSLASSAQLPAPAATAHAASASRDEREQSETDDAAHAVIAGVAELTLGDQAAPAPAPLAALPAQQVPERTCVICLEAPSCTLLLPCRHMPVCGAADCAAALGQPRLCPLCRVAVADTIEVFI